MQANRGAAMVTMGDIARLAGVSQSTVSHVLNETRVVSPASREAVLQAVAATGYRQNALARSLATSRTMTLGLASTPVSNPYFGDLVQSIERSARAAGYSLVLGDTHDDPDVEQQVVHQLTDLRVDGVLLAPSAGAMESTLPFLRSAGPPTVLLDRFADVDLDQVAPENEDATAMLVDHLADRGHRRIAMVTGLRGLHSSTERLAGYRRVVRQRGLDDDPALVLEGRSEVDAAEQAVLQHFAAGQRPSAIVIGNNAMTIGVMKALRLLRLRIPDDVALACYDDFEWADLFEPRLTAIAQDVHAMGARAVAMMVDRINDPDRPLRRERIAPQYRHRTSCGCPDPIGAPGARRADVSTA
jgi:LacI family transcriptional regulator